MSKPLKHYLKMIYLFLTQLAKLFETKTKTIKQQVAKQLTAKVNCGCKKRLNYNLKILESISRIENQISTNETEQYSLKFLQGLKSIKYNAKINTIQALYHCNN